MKDLFRSKKFRTGRIYRVFFYLTIFLIPLMLISSELDESLVDDVTAMITVAKKIKHTTFLLDTSESMNQFAYSDYINTCEDSIANIGHAIELCYTSYAQCVNVEDNAACNVSLGCGDIKLKCIDLEATETTLKSFCADIANIYSEPNKTATIANPLSGGPNDAKKFVGPWNPNDATYQEDLCFYNWTDDTNGDMLDMDGDGITNSQHYSNSDPDAVDRRDWDCLTDGVEPIQKRGGLWLNWKYATSLDAVKIILANTHKFSFEPRTRGIRKCVKTEYKPTNENSAHKKVCYREFETNPGAPATFQKIKEHVRANWEVTKTDTGVENDPLCDGTDNFEVDLDTVLPVDPDSKQSDVVNCEVCYDDYGETEVDCDEYVSASAITSADIVIPNITATVDYSCCSNFECADPKCRDDDSSCRSDGGACVLGYYSDFDQDPEHCCGIIACIEQADPATCVGSGTYLPGPGNDFTVEAEDDLNMPVLSAPNEYSNVTLAVTVKDLTFAPVANVDKVIVSVYYGCNNVGENPSNKIGEKEYNSPVATDTIVSVPVDLSGCEEVGYKVGATMQIFHSGADFSSATVTMDLSFSVKYDSGSEQPILVLDPAQFYYFEYKSEATGGLSDQVNEYECKTTIYHKQVGVVNGKASKCTIARAFPDPATRPEYCAPDSKTTKTIDVDSWGNTKKTACSWLCRDEVVYDDVWKCKGFFVQMDDPARGGPSSNVVTTKCQGDDPTALKDCCIAVHNTPHSSLELDPPEGVKFAAAGPEYDCYISGFEEGEADGERMYTSAYQAEVVKGHIQEINQASYKLLPSGWASPYSNSKWYSDAALINKSGGFLANSFVSVFETGKTGTRDISCIYDIVNGFEGEDCTDCLDLGCCSVDIGGGTDMCEYPSFWMKIPNTQGGKLIYPATILTGDEITGFKDMMNDLEAKGGSTLGETLYDVWRYLGGMYSIYDPNHNDNTPAGDPHYLSPFQGADVECFENTAVIVSGGQPQFDDNYSIESGKTTQAYPTDVPWVVPDILDVADPLGYKPYVRTNWYLTALEEVANWVHTKDFWHDNPICRETNNANVFGYEVGGTAADGTVCNTATDTTTGINVIDTIHAVAIGDWTLAPLYNNPANDYLEDSVIQNAAINNGGEYFGLTAKAVSQPPGVNTFNNLTELFNDFNNSGSFDDVASGRPHWTSALVQTFGIEMRAKGPEAYSPGAVPIDNVASRFWFGNLKKYTIGDNSSGCNLELDLECAGWERLTVPIEDCFDLTDSGADITRVEFRKIMAGGVASKIEDALNASSPTCSDTVGAVDPCFTSGARNIIYDDGAALLKLEASSLPFFETEFSKGYSGITTSETVQILDYIYGYDAFDYDEDLARNEVRFADDPIIEVDDPFNIDFTATTKIDIRPLLMGAIVHSKPVAVNYEDSDTTRIFVGANDGMFHSFDQDGNEVFAYIPKPVLPALTDFLDPRVGIFFNSSVDGPISLQHIDYNNNGMIDGEEQAYLIFGYRRGASSYTVLDISELDNPKFVQHIPVEGQSWGKPLVFRKCGGTSCTVATDLTYYLALPGGYDPCFDADSPACPLTASGNMDPAGNHIYIYKFNGATYDLIKDYEMTNAAGYANVRDHGFLRTSFVSAPVGINTDGKFSQDTEFVYITDVSSTVFRVDVRKNDPDDWAFRAVFRQRSVPQPITWAQGLRTYVQTNIYPPLTQYPIYEDATYTGLIPISLVTGNLVNPRAYEIDEMMVFYDRYEYPALSDPINSSSLDNLAIEPHGSGLLPGEVGWQKAFLSPDKITEKGISAPLMYYDRFEDNTYSLAWNTYIPNKITDCRDFGTSRNYIRNLGDGSAPLVGANAAIYESGDGYWDPTEECGWDNISIATDVSVVATSEGEDLTFSAGDDIFKKPGPRLVENPANIIKWYELY